MFVIGANSASTGYNLTRSLRFRASASAYLNRTPATTTNRQTWTWSGWVKRGVLGTNSVIFNDTGPLSNNDDTLGFNFSTNNELVVGTGSYTILVTSQVFRDPSAWYHFVVVFDTTQATANNRIKTYVNGVQITSFSTNNIATYIPQNFSGGINTTNAHTIANLAPNNGRHLDGYLTEVNFIDGQALTPSSFGSTNALTGVWQPARYTGTYGTNGFYLPFTDNSALTTSSNAGLGKDFSGNGNYWTTNNISITAGVTYDSMTDVPTLTSATAANFAVLNPLDKGANNTLSNGNLQFQITSATQGSVRGTFALPSTGKWYWEVTMTALGPLLTGIATSAASLTNYIGSDAFGWGYNSGDGLVYNNGTTIRANATLAAGDIVGVAFDSGAGSLSFYKNNVVQTTAITGFTPATINYFIAAGVTGGAGILNCGQRPFTYTAPTGFVALNTYNLPTSTIVKGNTVMDATSYTGTGASLSVTNTASFKPDLVWVKGRSNATDNELTDSVRGVTKSLVSNSTAAEATDTQGLTAFNSNGFTLGTDANYNGSARTFVGWQWQAGQGSTSSNANGTITSTVSVNASAGFSIVTYTGNGTNGATVGHGLGVKPSLIIEKGRTSAQNWSVQGCGVLWPTATQTLFLNNTSALNPGSAVAAPNSSVFTPSAVAYANESGVGNVAYCWTPIAGYSAFGSYTGNGATDGPFIYLGFRPKFVLFKRTDSAANWQILDSARNTYNLTNLGLYTDLAFAEQVETANVLDLLSNGFKVRGTGSASNVNSASYIYMAWAENPFKNSLAR